MWVGKRSGVKKNADREKHGTVGEIRMKQNSKESGRVRRKRMDREPRKEGESEKGRKMGEK